MLMLAKVALGLSATVAMSGAYVFHEGVIRVDVEEHRDGGSHVHVWVPATVVSAGMHFVPSAKMQEAATKARPYLPLIREVAKELEKYPDAEFVDVASGEDRVHVAMIGGKLHVDAVSGDGDVVHVSVPAGVLREVADELESRAPGV